MEKGGGECLLKEKKKRQDIKLQHIRSIIFSWIVSGLNGGACSQKKTEITTHTIKIKYFRLRKKNANSMFYEKTLTV